MTSKQRIVEIKLDRENLVNKPIKQNAQATKGLVTRRPALSEVGNKIHVQQRHNNVKNVQTKKAEVMGPPVAVPKKNVEVEVKKTEKPVLKKQNSTVKSFTTSLSISEDAVSTIAYSTKQLDIVDPDVGSKNLPQMVTEYLSDIYNHLYKLESDLAIREKYLEGHQSTSKMRTILVNWLVEVHDNFKLCLETLHLCVAIVDRYLQVNKNIGRESLQLVGTSALLIASKYEEMYMPDLEDFVYICDDSFSKKQILQMEIEILKKLNFDLGRPVSIHFLRRYNKIAQVRSEHHNLAKYILELALMEYSLCHVRPSKLAAAACCLSVSILTGLMNPASVWNKTLEHYTCYTYVDFKREVGALAHMLLKSEQSKYQSIRRKYASSKYGKISLNSSLKGPLIMKLSTQYSSSQLKQ